MKRILLMLLCGIFRLIFPYNRKEMRKETKDYLERFHQDKEPRRSF